MKRLFSTGIAFLLLWALAPGLGEVFESTVHFVREGHSAHATAQGDHHEPASAEHACTGAMHLCSCCISMSVLPARSIDVGPALESRRFDHRTKSSLRTASPNRVYHPPRA